MPAPDTVTWRADAACATADDPSLWFAGADAGQHGQTVADARRKREAVAICQSCPVCDECLTWALESNEPFGIWGGLLPRQRRTLRRTVRRAAREAGVGVAAAGADHGTRYTYQHAGCRCDACRKANTDYTRKVRSDH